MALFNHNKHEISTKSSVIAILLCQHERLGTESKGRSTSLILA